MKSTCLPDNILRCIPPAERKKLGKAGMTAEEVLTKAQVKNERELQRQLVGLLRLKGIEVIVSRMDKRTSNNVGTPDIIFAIFNLAMICKAVAWEVKFGQGALSDEQTAMIERMRKIPNGWHVKVIRSVDEALADLNFLGLT